ncbi:hypothetical protein [Mycobacterium sp. 852002-30065_SCH5024008]|uniref:hypothetical protein n=1 Tax=Mycobacterium sp. 852002-30065_SCH5024008 TaxID=1834088 RepID=UPI000800E723|nr:hypothetical protein [Mycobacterium sp. 852002-30065_SCH5024008]OBB90348.1 hypothetical protein A5781_23215 [Mycobacterium sp. 852002-30065_SCH5024008]
MTTPIAAHDPVEKTRPANVTMSFRRSQKLNAIVCRGDTVLVELTQRWRPTEEEIVRAAITVILVALVAVIGVAAGSILTMG